MNNKKVLITGGAGFVGSNLAKKLLEMYPTVEIVILDNFFTGDYAVIPKEVSYILTSDTWNIEQLFDKKEGVFDYVFHFGEYSRVVPSFKDIDYVLKTNLHGTTRVLEMARHWGAKFIYSASSSGFGHNGMDQHLCPYAWMKAKIVELIKNYGNWYGLQYQICYFFNVYGLGQIESGDYATVIGIFERQYKSNESLTVVSPGTQTRDFTHIDDIVSGVIAATNSNYINFEWHLRSGTNVSIIELAEMFNTKWKMIPERCGERENAEKQIGPGNATLLLGWQPKHNLKNYINSIINNHGKG